MNIVVTEIMVFILSYFLANRLLTKRLVRIAVKIARKRLAVVVGLISIGVDYFVFWIVEDTRTGKVGLSQIVRRRLDILVRDLVSWRLKRILNMLVGLLLFRSKSSLTH